MSQVGTYAQTLGRVAVAKNEWNYQEWDTRSPLEYLDANGPFPKKFCEYVMDMEYQAFLKEEQSIKHGKRWSARGGIPIQKIGGARAR